MTDPHYKTLVAALKKQPGGITVAGMAAKTALSLDTIRELAPRAADEYRARLEVTESGEILYSFPQGFTSRYRGLGPALKRGAELALNGGKRILIAAFKVWIMVMLTGYFVLFLLLALAAVVFMFAASASSSNNRDGRRNSGGGEASLMLSRLLGTVFRFWFYSNLFGGGRYSAPRRAPQKSGERPLYKQVFSFVFGDGDPNTDWKNREAKEVIAYLQGKKGVLSLPEFMIMTGLEKTQAEREMLSYCVRYGGMPEATEDGTVVYRFDPLLLTARRDAFVSLKTARKSPWVFSANKSGANSAFALINGVNLAFGAYFVYFILNLGKLIAGQALGGSFLFIFVYNLFAGAGMDAAAVIAIGLGVIPLVFSLFFWLIPIMRGAGLKKKNAAIRAENARKTAWERIWERPLDVTEEELAAVCGAGVNTDALIKETGVYSIPEISVDERGRTVYAFAGLAEERAALETYRAGIKDTGLGDVVFDSGR